MEYMMYGELGKMSKSFAVCVETLPAAADNCFDCQNHKKSVKKKLYVQ